MAYRRLRPEEIEPVPPELIGIPETWGNAQGPPCREFELDKIAAWVLRRLRGWRAAVSHRRPSGT